MQLDKIGTETQLVGVGMIGRKDLVYVNRAGHLRREAVGSAKKQKGTDQQKSGGSQQNIVAGFLFHDLRVLQILI